MKLENIVPWGRSLDEYRGMFHLSSRETQLTILDCGSGPASFNAEMTDKGHRVISCDPLYQYSPAEIAERIQETYPVVLNGVKETQDRFVWQAIASPEDLGRVRMASMNKFLADFSQGITAGRYRCDRLPTLSFSSEEFELALCSHLLFTYSEQLSFHFHLASIIELCRVATQVRVFPLITHFSGDPSPHLHPVIDRLIELGYHTEVRRVPYEFQRQGNQMLRVSRSPLPVLTE